VKEKFLLIFVVLVLATAPVLADRLDVDFETDFGSTTFSTPIAEMTSPGPPGPILFALTITARVWLDDVTGIYTYVYEFTDNGSSLIGIASVTIDTSFFDSTLNWGDVGDSIPDFVAFTTSFNGNLTFQFSSPLPSGGTYTVYAQSTNPQQEYSFWGLGYGPSGTGSILGADPPGEEHLYVAEAPSFLFLGTGLLVGVVGLGFFRQRFS